MGKTLYMAYGSNLNKAQMAERCPNAVALGPGVLDDYKLVFRAGGQGVYLTVEPCPGAEVPVGLWEVTPQDEGALDEYEGYPELYRRAVLPVRYQDAASHEPCQPEALIYLMHETYPLARPGQDYVNACRKGCEDFGLDTEPLLRAVAQAGQEQEVPYE